MVLVDGLTLIVGVVPKTPDGELHEYELPVIAADPKVTELPIQTELLFPTLAAGSEAAPSCVPIPFALFDLPGVAGTKGSEVNISE